MNTEPILNSVEEAIEDFRNGKIVIVVDDEDRENEGAACSAPPSRRSGANSSDST